MEMSNSRRTDGIPQSCKVYFEIKTLIYFIGPSIHCKCNKIGNMQRKKTAVVKTVKLRQEGKIENWDNHVLVDCDFFQ